MRILFALRWLEAALYDSGPDSFLKYWIALETLAMPDSTDIRPVNEALGRAYGMDSRHAADRFRVGRLFGLRSRIVHDGDLTPISGDVLLSMEAVFADVLFERFGLPCERRADVLLERPDVRAVLSL